MPTHKVKGGYKWGKHGKVYPTKKQADKQGQAIYASGWRENKTNEEIQKTNMSQKQIVRLTENDLYNIIKETVQNITKEHDDAKKKLQNTMTRTRYGNNNIHDYKGKAAMNALGINGEEGKEVAYNDKGVGEYDRYSMDENKQLVHLSANDLSAIIKESVNIILNEALSDYYDFNHFANDDMVKNYYNGYVIVDGTRAVLGQYDTYEEAVEDAKQMARQNKYGTYEVYGCDENGYALEEDYPEDNTLVYSTDEDFA